MTHQVQISQNKPNGRSAALQQSSNLRSSEQVERAERPEGMNESAEMEELRM
jgi:hypothetical protein